MSWPPGNIVRVGSPSKTTGCRFARAAYTAAVHPAGPEPMITMFSRFIREGYSHTPIFSNSRILMIPKRSRKAGGSPASTLDIGMPPTIEVRAERLLTALAGVVSARAVADDVGRICEIHILANPDLHPKQIVRNVESALSAGLGVVVDRRIVSVA